MSKRSPQDDLKRFPFCALPAIDAMEHQADTITEHNYRERPARIAQYALGEELAAEIEATQAKLTELQNEVQQAPTANQESAQ